MVAHPPRLPDAKSRFNSARCFAMAGSTLERDIAAANAREDGLQAVVIVLRDRVELVVVAAGALDRQPLEGVEDGGDDVVAVEVTADFAVDRVLADVAQRALVPRPGREKAQGRDEFWLVREEDICGDLFLHETGIGCIRVEGTDQVVAITPGVRPDAVLVVAVRLGEVDGVHPESRHPLTVCGRGQKSIDESLVCIEPGVGRRTRQLRWEWGEDQ